MIKTTPSKPTAWTLTCSQRAKLTISSLALLLCTACGGGGTSSTAPTAPPPVAVNQAPVASASSKLSIVAEGQKFELDASGSTDSNGDSLTYSWQQLSGPTIDMASATSETLSLTAPLLDADEDVSFELTVSDGTLSNVSTVSLNIENLKVDEVQSEVTEFGPGEPANPQETVPETSVFEGRRPLTRIIGLTPEADGGYRVHWTAFYSGQDTPVSSQVFSAEGEKVGPQTDGVFLGPEREPFQTDENGEPIFAFRIGLNFATLQSGDTLFNLNGELQFEATEFNVEYLSHQGLVDGEVDGLGELILDLNDLQSRGMGGAFTPIADDKVLLILGERTTDDAEDETANITLTSLVVDRFGQTEEHNLDEYAANGTVSRLNGMTATDYNGDSYLTAWAHNTLDAGYDIRMQRATQDGVILGPQEPVTDAAGNQLEPRSATLTNGNMIVTWLSPIEGEDALFEIRARVVQPDGSFASDEISLGGRIPFDLSEAFPDTPFYEITALITDEVLVTWEESVAGEPSDDTGETVPDAVELQAMAFDAELNAVSNLFTLAAEGAAENISQLIAITLPDNRVVLGWYNDYFYQDVREDTSHTIGFYPVGKE